MGFLGGEGQPFLWRDAFPGRRKKTSLPLRSTLPPSPVTLRSSPVGTASGQLCLSILILLHGSGLVKPVLDGGGRRGRKNKRKFSRWFVFVPGGSEGGRKLGGSAVHGEEGRER